MRSIEDDLPEVEAPGADLSVKTAERGKVRSRDWTKYARQVAESEEAESETVELEGKLNLVE